MTPFLFVLGLALVFEGGQCQALEVFVAEGSVAVLPCVDETSALSHPTAVHWSRRVEDTLKTVWRRGKSGLVFRPVRDSPRADCPIPNFGKNEYNLHINGITSKDAGQYVCEVEGKTQKMVKDITLRVIKVSFSPAIVVEGSKAKAECNVSSGMQLVRTKWKRNDKSIKRMMLEHVTQKDAGEWTCQVSYNNGVAEATGFLEVRGISKPQDDSSVLYAAVGSSVSLPCVFTDGLIPNTVSWTRTSTATNSPSLLPKSNWSSVSPTIQSVEDGNEGMYTCAGLMEGRNGNTIEVKRTMKLVVAQVLRSSSSSGDGAVTLTCRLSSSSQVTSYEWLRVTYGPNDTEILTSVQKTKSPTIKQVTEKDAGEWVCRFYGSEGLLGNVTYQLHMMGAMKSEKLSSNNKTAMVIGLGFLFLVMFLILFQMYRNNRRRRKALLYPAMETIVHQAATDREWRERRDQRTGKMTEACVGEPKSVCV